MADADDLAAPPPPLAPGDAVLPAVPDGKLTGDGDRAALATDVARLVVALLRSPTVPRAAKLRVVAALGYAVIPKRGLPGVLGRLGPVDELALLLWALRRLIADAGYDAVRAHWSGTDGGFALVLMTAGVAE